MKILFGQREKEYLTWTAGMLWQEIEAELEAEGLLLNYLVVDGEEVWEDFEGYLKEREEQLQVIEVMALTFAEYTRFVAGEAAAASRRTAEEAKRLSDFFYGFQENKEDWEGLSSLVADISAGFPALELLYSLLLGQERSDEAQALETHHACLQEDLQLLHKPLMEQDVIYIADLLHFEIEKELRAIGALCSGV